MNEIDIDEAKQNFLDLVASAANGRAWVITKAGQPLASLESIAAGSVPPRRLGFLAGQIRVPDDFDRMGDAGIAALFGAGDPQDCPPAEDMP